MKKRSIILTILFIALSAAAAGQTRLTDLYKKGRIVLGADEDWTGNLPSERVFETRGDLVVGPDGSVFVSNTTGHMVYKFDKNGKFVRTIGRHGQGPGDLNFPGRLSVLDGKYLVVGGYATDQKIALFDLDGTFVKSIATGRFTSKPVALKNGKIAYGSTRGRMQGDEMINSEEIFIRDAWSGAEKSVVRYEIRNPMTKLPGGGIVMAAQGAVALAPTRDGGLITGTTQNAILDVFSGDGTRIRTIDLGWKASPVTSEYREKYKAILRREAKAAGRKPSTTDPLLPQTLEILRDIWVDAEGNLLAVRKTDCLEDCPAVIRAYSPDGEFLSEFEIDPGPFVLSVDWRFKRIVLTDHGIYGLLEFKDDPDGFLHLIRSDFR